MEDNDKTIPHKPTVYYTQTKKKVSASHEARPSKKNTLARKKSISNAGNTTNSNGKETVTSFSKMEQAAENKLRESIWRKNYTGKPPTSAKTHALLAEPVYGVLRNPCQEESTVCTASSCAAVFKQRPTSIVRAYFVDSQVGKFRDQLNWLVDQRLRYELISEEQMGQLTKTLYHGGICLLVKKR